MEGFNEDKMYYSIGEVAEMLKINQTQIRYWEKNFDILQPKRNKKGNRYFRQIDVENIKKIQYYIKEKGLTINGTKQKLKGENIEAPDNFELINKLKNIRQHLLNIKQSIK